MALHRREPAGALFAAGVARVLGSVVLGAAPMAASLAWAGGTLTVAMTAGDIPVVTGNPDQGFEGYRFVGYNLYDALLLWDLSKADKASEIKPGLATSWEIDPNDHKRWVVHLRRGAKFHDGCEFKADDVVWNYQYRMDQKAPYFLAQQLAYSRTWLTNIKSVDKIDDYTVAFENNFVESLFPYSLSYVMMVSQCRAKELGYDWSQYA
ncbi:MAG: ABC transporter substrate-binding protein, partial [Alphaproteobacteria bacterium]|nr:ABC transporter substrate-binding protein [Alphaproteobacteria bacterium]